jgi:hypothetical protein
MKIAEKELFLLIADAILFQRNSVMTSTLRLKIYNWQKV